MRSVRRISNSRFLIKLIYYIWIAFPYRIRKPLTGLGILWILSMKKAAKVDKQNKLTRIENLGNLSFWGVPNISAEDYSLKIDGLVERPVTLSLPDLEGMDVVERHVRMDCVGGFRNNTLMKGVPIKSIFDLTVPNADAIAVVFTGADGYSTAHLISDLIESDAFLAWEVNGRRIARFGFPLRLVARGTYGYKWAKWIVKIELSNSLPKGYWEERGLPHKGRIGDFW